MNWKRNLKVDYGINSTEHFADTLSPTAPIVAFYEIRKETPVERPESDSLYLLYIQEGSGTLCLNEKKVPVEPGMMILLHSCHYFKLSPIPAGILRFSKCSFTMNTMLFFYMCPYVDKHNIIDTFSLSLASVPAEMRLRIETILHSLQDEANGELILSSFRQFLLLMELVGYFGLNAEKYQHNYEET